MPIARLSVGLEVVDGTGDREDDATRYGWSCGDSTALGVTRERITLPGMMFTALNPPVGAKSLLIKLGKATSLMLKGVAGDVGTPIAGASNPTGAPILMPLGASPVVGIANGSASDQVVECVWTWAPVPSPSLTTILDTFSRPDADLLGSTEAPGVILPWVTIPGQMWGVRANRAARLAGTGTTLALLATGWSDAQVLAIVPTIGTNKDGICFRCDGGAGGSGWLFVSDDTGSPGSPTWRLFKFSGAVLTQMVDSLIVPNSGDVLQVIANGPNISISVNFGPGGSVTDSFMQSATRHGLASRSVTFTTRFDAVEIDKL